MPQKMNLAQKLINSKLIDGTPEAGREIALKIDQALLQDATGTLVMLELEAMGIDKVKTDVAVQYVDHNLLQADFKNADDHVFLKSGADRFGMWFSRPGNGVSHVVHMDRFGKPGATMVGSDSHTCAAGSLGMLAFGTGGLDVAMAFAGEPYFVKMPKIMGVELKGELPDWVSAKDVILEMLRRHDVKGGKGFIIEYYGDGLDKLTAMDRHVIANMGAELGATTSVFPSDEMTRKFLKSQGREDDWQELKADEGCNYDEHDTIDLSKLVPLIAKPHSPGNVVPVSEVAGAKIHQVVIGSSANPGLRDFRSAANIMSGRAVNPEVSFDVNPTSRQVTENLTDDGSFGRLMAAGARFHQSGCMGCIGMGQAPASGKISLRTMPRNFKGRSGTLDDRVYLCSPETAAASALTGCISDPRDMEPLFGIEYSNPEEPENYRINAKMLVPPSVDGAGELEKGPNIKSIPELDELRDSYSGPVLLKMEDNISTDEILKAGAEVLPYRSNLPKISEWAFAVIDPGFHEKSRRAMEKHGGHLVVAGENYAQGSSREHAALAPRYLGQFAVIAKSYARIGWQNLVNFGIAPLEFINSGDYDDIEQEDLILIENLRDGIKGNSKIFAKNDRTGKSYELAHSMSGRQADILLAGGLINFIKNKG
jgi:aconitate hydratase